MADLLLRESEQVAVRAVIASEPAPGTALPAASALQHLAQLIVCDAIGIALLDNTGSTLEVSALPLDRTTVDRPPPYAGPLLGVQQLDRTPTGDGPSATRGVAVLSLGVRKAPDHVVKLWMVRGTNDFSGRDRALLSLVAPALERLLRARSTSALPPSLTLQEQRVLRHVATGLSNAEIAERLTIAPCTVRKHLENAYRKLGVTNRTAAVFSIQGGHPVSTGRLEPNVLATTEALEERLTGLR